MSSTKIVEQAALQRSMQVIEEYLANKVANFDVERLQESPDREWSATIGTPVEYLYMVTGPTMQIAVCRLAAAIEANRIEPDEQPEEK